uniref:Ig-like domain-containing protein n=1 Tax=Pelusios castaneus TaxID=367368 RepID=A0A8C8S0K7_9SAUR
MPFTVTWLVDGQKGKLDGVTEPAKRISGNNTFSTKSTAKITQDEWLEGKTYTCQVSHPGSGSEVQDHATLLTPALLSSKETTLSSDIQVFLMPPSPAALYVDKNPKLTCLVVSMRDDKDLQVVWSQQKPGSLNPEPLDLKEQFNETYTASISLPISTHDWEEGETFTCKVTHSDLPAPIIKTISKNPVIYLLHPHPEELTSSGDTISLTCLVRGFFPKDITTQWQKNYKPDENLKYITTPPMKDGDGDSNYFLYSKLKVNKDSWNRGDTYTCMVIHEALSTKMIQKTVSKVSGK